MLGDDRVGRRLLPTQSVSGVGVWERLHLGVRPDALELRNKLYRFWAGDHYGNDKSIKDDR